MGGYVGARRCSGYATVGAKALMSWYLGAYAAQGAANLGIYVCKSIAGSATTSLHGEGRAVDLGSRPYRQLPFLDDVADALVAHSKELGVQCVIHDDRIWSSSYPNAGWRDYGGTDPHRGHVHAELTPWAAANLTVDAINRQLGKPVARPTPPPSVDWTKGLIVALPTLRPGRGLKTPKPDEDVQTMQQLLQARGIYDELGKTGADGRWGDGTTAGLKKFQRSVGIPDDAVCGKVTWHYLLRQQALLKK
jgi:hypothetical protein